MELDPEAAPFLSVAGKEEVWSCSTIECTRHLVGKEMAWYATRTFYSRNPRTGAASLIGYLLPGSCDIDAFEAVPVKLLMHPMRKGHGGPAFDLKAFQQAVRASAIVSKHWGLGTALRSLFAVEDCLQVDDYPTPQSRRQLFDELVARWSSKAICTSVVIMVWQNYFKISCSSADFATQQILRWMPLLADKTMPSVMVNVLTKCGWILCGNLDA
jgi:hypothetical protein